MYFTLLATDYDGTLAHDGVVDDNTVDALGRLRASGRKLLLVTGRHLPDLSSIFPRLDIFDRVIVENGGVLYNPHTREEKLLCGPADPRLVASLRARHIPFDVGRTVIATWRPYDSAVQAAIRDLGLEMQVIFNKESVMVLPSGVDKGTALERSLDELAVSLHQVISVGDAENDLSFLQISGCSAAVANALPSVKEQADIVVAKPRGAGVTELIDWLIGDDLAEVKKNLRRPQESWMTDQSGPGSPSLSPMLSLSRTMTRARRLLQSESEKRSKGATEGELRCFHATRNAIMRQ